MTVQELIGAAKAAIASGDLEKAAQFKEQAQLLQEVEGLQPVEAEVAPTEGDPDSVKAIQDRLDALEKVPANETPIAVDLGNKNVNIVSATKLGDDELKALAHFTRTGDSSGIKASTDDITAIATDANAGYAVPTAHYQNIVAKRNESSLRDALGLTFIPGTGTTANVTVDAAGDGKFVVVGEQNAGHTNNFDRDTPPVGRVTMTFQKFTKKIELTDEMLEDEDARLMTFIENYIGRGLSNTWNDQIVTKALAGATSNIDLTGTDAIATGEVPAAFYTLPDGYEDNASWILRRATEGMIMGLTGDAFQFVDTPAGVNTSRKELWQTPVYSSMYMPAVAASAQSILLGDFAYMGYREAPSLTFIRDPYSVDGAIVLKYYTRFVVEVLIGEAFVTGTQAAT